MAKTISGAFETRRDAEMAVERLVQEYGLERTDIFIEPETAANSAGEVAGGADVGNGHSSESKARPALAGRIKVSVDLNDKNASGKVENALQEFGASGIQTR